MKIKDLFLRDIDRDIQGVIKVGQEENENIYDELNEYVVTHELQKHFRDFFSAYEVGLDRKTDKMGVWISGFFGSGKSHFLKILSYILENKKVSGRNAIDFFVKDEKITDDFVIAQMEKAANTPTDVVLFNIDSKSDSGGLKTKDSILNVFLKVFNEMLGYSTDPHLAELERSLDNNNKYHEFKELYYEKYNTKWSEARHEFNFYRGRVQEVLVEINHMSENDAKLWSDSTTSPYQISIGGFAKLVKSYLDKQEKNHHIVFLVDEVGQYIGADTDLMLNLQTITEDLGRYCEGKAWVVVTSQQDIDSMTKVVGDDFSKIQGRFDTRLSLTSAHVDEVIKLRILEKKPVGLETLKLEYENKETILNNLIIFNDAVEKRRYDDAQNFAEIYPFIPYQFDILGYVLTAIRKFGATGKHLSSGERSMLGIFKQSAEAIKDRDIGEIVPLNLFYDGLEKFLDHSHSGVIKRAYNNQIINKYSEDDCFNINVLKTLFLIKYVDQIEPNIDNITTLMVSNVNNDRHDLKAEVDSALKILEQQMLIQRVGDSYIFLTDQEQEINRDIQSQNFELSEVNKVIEEIIFESILPEDKVNINNNTFKNRYIFYFEKYINDYLYKRADKAVAKVKFITPDNDIHGSVASLSAISLKEQNTLFVEMDNDASFIREIEMAIKIDKFMKSGYSQKLINIEDIKSKKHRERQDNLKRAENSIRLNLENVNFYLNGSQIEATSSNFKNNIIKQLEELALIIYNKLSYIDFFATNSDIHNLLAKAGQQEASLDTDDNKNIKAINEVLDHVETMSKNKTLTLRDVINRFSSEPYGFVDLDVQWIVTKLFVDNKISLSFSGEKLNVLKNPVRELVNYITRITQADRLVIDIQEIIPDFLIKELRDISMQLFQKPPVSEDPSTMVEDFKSQSHYLMNEIRQTLRLNESYPGKEELKAMLELLQNVHNANTVTATLNYLQNQKENFDEAISDYQDVKSFYGGNQQRHWDEALVNLEKYENEKHELNIEKFESIINNINNIMKMQYPYNALSQMPNLNEQFKNEYEKQLETKKQPLFDSINDHIAELATYSNSYLKDNSSFVKSLKETFGNTKRQLDKLSEFSRLNALRSEINQTVDNLTDLLNQLNQKENETKSDVSSNVIPIKRKQLKELLNNSRVSIESQADINEYIETIRTQLEKELEDADKIIITF